MEDKPRILQQRVEIAPFYREIRQRAGERVGGKQDEQQKTDANHPHHRKYAGDDIQRHPLGKQRDGKGPAAHQQHPQQQRAFMRPPGGGDAVPDRQLRVGVTGDVNDGEIIHYKGVDQHQKGAHHEDKQQPGKRSCRRHHPRIASRHAPQRID